MSLYPLKLFYQAIQEEQYFQIGSFKKPIGIHGGVVALFLYEPDDVEWVKLPALFVEIDHIKVPYAIKNIILTAHKTIVQLDHIQSKTEAYALRNLPLFLPASLKPKWMASTTPYSFLVDCVVDDLVLGRLGQIETIYCVRGQYIMAINYQEKELLIPYPNPFMVSVDAAEKQVILQLPEGYLEVML